MKAKCNPNFYDKHDWDQGHDICECGKYRILDKEGWPPVPNIVYLQLMDDEDTLLEEPTWSPDKIFDSDLIYRLDIEQALK